MLRYLGTLEMYQYHVQCCNHHSEEAAIYGGHDDKVDNTVGSVDRTNLLINLINGKTLATGFRTARRSIATIGPP
jgi:hypothetical protein